MVILKYNFFSSETISKLNSITNLKNDLYIHLGSNMYDDDLIFTYMENFIKYYESIRNMIIGFLNDIDGLEYNVEFELEFFTDNKKNIIPNFTLKNIYLDKNYETNKISKQIKKSDYNNITNVLDYNYEINVNTNPYFIVNISKTDNYIIHDNFYKGKYTLLKKYNTNEFIEVDYDRNLIYHFDMDKYNIDCENSNYLDTNTFRFYNKKLCVNGGPIYKIIKSCSPNQLIIDNELYEIDIDSTVDILDFI